MKQVNYPSKVLWPSLTARPAIAKNDLQSVVSEILTTVRSQGDAALRRYSLEFDRVELESLAVAPEHLALAGQSVATELRKAIELAINNITSFHQAQAVAELVVETMPGVICSRRAVPINPVGIYIPAGTAPLFSTVLMLAIPAKLAGCKQIVFCSPPAKTGDIDPTIAFVANHLGISEVFAVGGAQAIAAMAYGTESIPKVKKIFGPGNQFVTAAKEIVQQQGTAIDMPAGPTELALIVDSTAVPSYVAADVLSQLEHGIDSQVVLVSTCSKTLDSVQLELKLQIKDLPRRSIVEQALANSCAILLSEPSEAIELINDYAPEHLILALAGANQAALQITNAGSVFIGNFAAEAIGDYASGTNHVLPTSGWAAASSGVSLDSFVKYITFQELTATGLQNVGPAVCQMAEAEQLAGHAQAVKIRLRDL